MAEEEVGIRLALKNRREVERGVHQVGDEFDRVGDEAERAGRKARIGAAGLVSFGKSGRIAGRAVVYGMGAAAAGIVATGVVVTRFSSNAINKASDLNETVSKSRVIFGKHSRDMLRWSRSADDSLGLSQNAALGTAATFGDMFSQIGFVNSRAAKLSRGVVRMASDFGSFNNLETEDVLDRVSAAFRGEYDSIQAIVPNLNAARVETVALTLSHKKEADALTAREKALAVLNILHKDGSRAMGDFARTSDGLANQEKILAAQYENASAKLGKSLMPVKLEFIGFLNREGIPLLDRFARWFDRDGIPAIKRFGDQAIPVVQDLVEDGRPLAESILPAIGTGATTIADAFKVIAPRAKAVFDGFNDLPDWAKSAIALTAGGAVVGKKVGAFNLGKSVLGGVTAAKPLPVYVVNNGGLPGGTGGPTGAPGGGGKPKLGAPGGTFGAAMLALGLGFANSDSAIHNLDNPRNKAIADGTIKFDTDGSMLRKMTADRAEYIDWFKTATAATKGINEHTRGVIAGVDQVDSKVGKAKNSTQQLLNVLNGTDKNWSPTLQITGLDAAYAKVTALESSLLGMGGYGNGLGVLAPGRRRNKGGPRVNRPPAFPGVDLPKVDEDFFGPTGRVGAGDRPVQLVLRDGRVLADVVYDDAEDKVARK